MLCYVMLCYVMLYIEVMVKYILNALFLIKM